MGTIISESVAKAKVWCRAERGSGIVESLVAVSLVAVAIVGFVMALSTGSTAVNVGAQETVAQQLARTQLEYVKGYPYDPEALAYPTVDAPGDYVISVDVDAVPGTDDGIQKVTVTIAREGESILTIDEYKVDR